MTALRQLRIIALLEGVSLLVLLLIAMPLKHAFGMPIAVRIAGSIHGLLFLMFVSALFRASLEHKWPLRRSLLALGAAMLPGGTLLFDATQAPERTRG